MAEGRYPSYTVSQITSEIGARLKTIGPIVLSGEISGWRQYPSGHAYFTLKDEAAQISAVMFASDLQRTVGKIGAVLKDGAKVELFGSVGVYANRGNYQFVARSARLVGVGDLMQRYLALKAKLEAEGLFDKARKRPLPFLPRRIAIVTSEAGAVIHDMCTVLTRRFPALEIRLYPSLVQGEAAPKTIIAGIEHFNASTDWSPDLLIVARGGGSFEDLFCFNDEALVRAVAASRIPTISAVGHETDFTLCDFAADVRAGTPSIAAELAVPVLADLKAQLADFSGRLVGALRGKGEWCAQRVDQLADSLTSTLTIALGRAERRLSEVKPRPAAALALALERANRRLAGVTPRLLPAVTLQLERERSRFERARTKLELLSPYSVLDRGYSLTTAADGSVVRDASALKPGDRVSTRLARGEFQSVVQ